MDAFIRQHQSFLLSTLFFVASLMLLGYSALYTRDEAMIAGSQAALKIFKQENKDLQARKASMANKEEKTQDGIRSLPAFLRRINDIAKETKVIIRSLIPDPDDKLVFHLTLIEDYFDFLRFGSMLESLDVSIHNIEVHPYNLGKTPPLHAISFSLTPRNDAETLSGQRLASVRARVAEKDKRNPFQRFVGLGGKVKPEVDLTWVYKLSGIGKSGDTRYATVNSRDYGIGDSIDGMIITHIERSRIRLEKDTADGKQKFILNFRRQREGVAR